MEGKWFLLLSVIFGFIYLALLIIESNGFNMGIGFYGVVGGLIFLSMATHLTIGKLK